MTGASLPSFSVVLPTYNRSDIVEQTLERLLTQDYPSDLVEILVVDNSTDGTPEMVERLAAGAASSLRLIRSTERLPAVKRNEALEAASGDLICYMNDDLWVVPEYLAEHARAHLAEEGPVAVLGHCRQSPQMPRTPFIEYYEPFAYHLLEGREGASIPYRFFWTMNISLPVRAMRERNLRFHEDWREIGHEDLELGWRWTRAGLPIVYNPQATGEHYHPHSLESACRLQESIGRGIVDLEKLVEDPDLLENYGVFSWHNSPRSVARSLARIALFNRLTVPAAICYLEAQQANSALTRFMYWKVLLHYTNKGYRSVPSRHVAPVPTVAPGECGDRPTLGAGAGRDLVGAGENPSVTP